MNEERFFAYSRGHTKPIRLLILQDGKAAYMNALIVTWDDETVVCLKSGRKRPRTLPREAVLSASYARGDEGDTLQFERGEGEK